VRQQQAAAIAEGSEQIAQPERNPGQPFARGDGGKDQVAVPGEEILSRRALGEPFIGLGGDK
jgi:hypothetical protein